MKKWRDWLRERFPHWWPFPYPDRTMKVIVPRIDGCETLVTYTVVSKALLNDAKNLPALANQIADTTRLSAHRASRERLGLV